LNRKQPGDTFWLKDLNEMMECLIMLLTLLKPPAETTEETDNGDDGLGDTKRVL